MMDKDLQIAILQQTVQNLKAQLGEAHGNLAEANAKVNILNQALKQKEEAEAQAVQEKKVKKK